MDGIVQYVGKWEIPGCSEPVGGTLSVSSEGRFIELILQCRYDSAPGKRGLLPRGGVDFLHGKLFSGNEVSLFHCESVDYSCQVGSHITEWVSAEFAFWGLGEPDPIFRGALVDFGEIVEWSGLCSYKWDHDLDSFVGTLVWERGDTLAFELPEGMKLEIYPLQGGFTPTLFCNEVKAEQRIIFSIEYDCPTSWEKIVEAIRWIRSFIELGMSTGVVVKGIKYLHDNKRLSPSDVRDENRGELVPADVSIGVGDSKRIDRTSMSRYYSFTLEEAATCGVLALWFEKRDVLEPVVGLYTTAYSVRNESASTFFLCLAQALETFHARFFDSDVKLFIKRIDGIINENSTSDNCPSWLIDSGQRAANRIFLKSRLNELLYADGIKPVEMPGLDIPTFSEKKTATRDYYTHYDDRNLKKAFSVDELLQVNGKLLLLLEYHLMRVLGFEREFAAERVSRKNWKMFCEDTSIRFI